MENELKKNEKLPLVSVIVPCYNHEKYVVKTIESIINQTYKNIELIVIDDGSKDNSVKIIRQLENKYNFAFIHRQNKGLSATLNEGIRLSKGKYICFLASDDYWDLSKIEKQVCIMEENENISMSFTEFYEINSNNEIVGRGVYTKRKNPFYDFENVLKYADLPPASLMCRKICFENIKGFDETLKVEDLYIWLKILEQGGVAKVINEPLSFYRIHENNTHSDNLMITREHFKTINMFIHKSNNPKSILREWSLRNANILARTNKKESFSYLIKGLNKFWDVRVYKVIFKILFISK